MVILIGLLNLPVKINFQVTLYVGVILYLLVVKFVI